jgi:uncharacterized protein YaeQ
MILHAPVKMTERFDMRIFVFILHVSEYTNFSKTLETCLNTKHLMGDTNHVPNWGNSPTVLELSARWCSWLTHCAKSRNVSVSISDVVTEIVNLFRLSGRNMALGSTQPLTEMKTRFIS